MSILRKIKRIIIGYNHDRTRVDKLGQTNEFHNESNTDGSVESFYIEEKINQKCGCFADIGGRCAECGGISCINCHRHCGGTDNPIPVGCGKPICREHTHYKIIEGIKTPLCSRCAGKVTRKKYRQITTKLLLNPFIEFEKDSENE